MYRVGVSLGDKKNYSRPLLTPTYAASDGVNRSFSVNHGARPPRLQRRTGTAAAGATLGALPAPCHTLTPRPCLHPCQSSGVQVQPECLTVFEEMKIRSAYKVRRRLLRG